MNAMLANDPPTIAQQKMIGLVNEAVDAWTNGDMNLSEADLATGDGWLRTQVLLKLSPDDPYFKKLWNLIDALDARRESLAGDFRSRQGYVTRDMITEHNGRFAEQSDDSGETITFLQFPLLVPQDGSAPQYRSPSEIPTYAKDDEDDGRWRSEWEADWNATDVSIQGE